MPLDSPSSRRESRFTRTLNRILVALRVEEVPHIKRIVVTVVGGTVLIFGVILIVTPGPAVLVIPVGLAILGTEYAWARRWMRKARTMADKALSRTQRIIGSATSAVSKSPPKQPVAPAAKTEGVPAAGSPTDGADESAEAMAGASCGAKPHEDLQER